MKAFGYTLYLKTKLDFKSADILITNYLVPLIFFGVMGVVFTSIMPDSKETLVYSMTIFAVTMGALIGIPASVSEYFKNDLRKSFRSAGIPLSTIVLTSVISGLANLSIVSLIIFMVAPLAFDAAVPKDLLLYVFSFTVFILTTILVGILIGLISKNTSQLTIISQVIFLPSMMLSGIMFPSEMLPTALQYVGYVLPASHAMIMMTSSTLEITSLLSLIGFTVILSVLIVLRLKRLKFEDQR